MRRFSTTPPSLWPLVFSENTIYLSFFKLFKKADFVFKTDLALNDFTQYLWALQFAWYLVASAAGCPAETGNYTMILVHITNRSFMAIKTYENRDNRGARGMTIWQHVSHEGTPWWQPGSYSTAPPSQFCQKSLIGQVVKLSTPCELEYISDQLSDSSLLYDAPPCVLLISHFICTFVAPLYLVISDAQYSKFVQHCVCSPVKWVTISQCRGDLARTTLMDKIPLKLWRWEELVLVDGKKFREICIQLPVHFFS